jgi:spermidine/putrescine transport system permease protein
VTRAAWRDAVRRFGYGGLVFIFGGCAFWAVVLIVLPALLMVDQAARPFLPRSEWGGPKDVYTLQNLVAAVGEPLNQLIFFKTIWASVLVTAIALLNAYPLSFILVRGGGGAAVGVIMIGLLIPFWVNEILRAFAWQLLLARFGPLNNLLVAAGVLAEPYPFLNHDVGVIVGLTYAYILFMIFPLYSAMESLDPNQLDAARDLGAPGWRIHWDIVIPHAKPGIASGCIVTFMLAAGSFAVPQILGGTSSLWVTQLIYNQFDAINWNLGAAYGVALVVLCLVFVLAMMSVFRVRLQDIAR